VNSNCLPTYAGVEYLDMERVDDILAPAGEALTDHLVVGGVHVHNLQNDQRILAQS
jgi:hypothetical protein